MRHPPFLTVRSASADETRRLGMRLGELVRPGDVVLLNGGLGSGKTTFVQGLARGLGVTEQCRSPSYTIMHPYEGRFSLVHVDLYRLGSAREVHDLGLDELLGPPNVVAIEWGERASALVENDHLDVSFDATIDVDEVRTIVFHPYGRFAGRMRELTESLQEWLDRGV